VNEKAHKLHNGRAFGSGSYHPESGIDKLKFCYELSVKISFNNLIVFEEFPF
jgi:hypothetical protein